jgi:hypothetical protein
MPVDASDMTLVHRVFRREFDGFPELVAAVPPGDTARAKVIGEHLRFMVDGLHHHHASEDELVWPKLVGRDPDRRDVIERMEAEHADIAAAVLRAQASQSMWQASADPALADQLSAGIAELTALIVKHLDDEERNAVPIIEEHLTDAEWGAALKRGASFLSSHPRLGIVLGGLVLDYASSDERLKFLSGVPQPQRLLLKLLSGRMTAAYRRQLYAL